LQYSRILPEALCKNRENRRKQREDANEDHKPGDVQVPIHSRSYPASAIPHIVQN
jgi:hypothetical protein